MANVKTIKNAKEIVTNVRFCEMHAKLKAMKALFSSR
jgi:hypothetical protein